jgi:hypothetical protein
MAVFVVGLGDVRRSWKIRGSNKVKAQLFIAHLREVFGSPPYWDSSPRST